MNPYLPPLNPQLLAQLAAAQGGQTPGAYGSGLSGFTQSPAGQLLSQYFGKRGGAPGDIDYTALDPNLPGPSPLAPQPPVPAPPAPPPIPGQFKATEGPPLPPDISPMGGPAKPAGATPGLTPGGAPTPAGWQSAVPPEAEEQLRKGMAEERQGLEAELPAQQKLAETKAGAAREVASAQEENVNLEKLAQAKEDATVRDETNRWHGYQDLAANGRVNSHKIFEGDKGALFLALSSLGQAFGAFGQAMTGSRQNAAAEIVQATIDRSVHDQEVALDQKNKTAQAKGRELQELRDKIGDDRKARDLLAARRIEQYKALGDAEVASLGSQVYAAQWQQVKGQLDQKQAGLLAAVKKPTPAIAVGGMAGAAGGPVSDIKPAEVMRLDNGTYVSIPNAEQHKEIGHKLAVARAVEEALPRIERLAKMPMAQRMAHYPQWHRELQEASKVFTAPEIQEAGRGSLGVFQAVADPLNPTFGHKTPGVVANARDIAQKKRAEADAALRNHAQYRLQPVLARDKQGRTVPSFAIVGEYQGAAPKPAVPSSFTGAGAP